jgi:serine-type D-Ala-D-Ala carboxypeptidase/endopeptidase (penicillin-binding protein 4)
MSPQRRSMRPNPVVVLFLLALIPAFAFGSLWRWAEARKAQAKNVVPSISAVIAPRLNTPLLSFRRTPGALAESITIAKLRAELAPLTALVGDTSCLVVAAGSSLIINDGADTPVTPASNMKLLTGAAALELLGPEFRYTTELRGVAVNGVVEGDLYLIGGGDPLLSTADYPATQKHPPTAITPLEALVSNLIATGISQDQWEHRGRRKPL